MAFRFKNYSIIQAPKHNETINNTPELESLSPFVSVALASQFSDKLKLLQSFPAEFDNFLEQIRSDHWTLFPVYDKYIACASLLLTLDTFCNSRLSSSSNFADICFIDLRISLTFCSLNCTGGRGRHLKRSRESMDRRCSSRP